MIFFWGIKGIKSSGKVGIVLCSLPVAGLDCHLRLGYQGHQVIRKGGYCTMFSACCWPGLSSSSVVSRASCHQKKWVLYYVHCVLLAWIVIFVWGIKGIKSLGKVGIVLCSLPVAGLDCHLLSGYQGHQVIRKEGYCTMFSACCWPGLRSSSGGIKGIKSLEKVGIVLCSLFVAGLDCDLLSYQGHQIIRKCRYYTMFSACCWPGLSSSSCLSRAPSHQDWWVFYH